MRIILLLALISISYNGLSQSRGNPSSDSDTEGMTAEEVELIVPVVSQFFPQTQFSMAFINDGEVKYIGLTLYNGKVVPIKNRDSVFEIGSISKVFTTHLLSDLVKSGKVTLDDPIASKLSFTLRGEPRITFEQLATHQSGLPYFPSNVGGLFNQKNPFKDYSQEKFEQFLADRLKMKIKPGEQYVYSNVGMALLGNIVASINGKSYEMALQDKIFKPLGMEMSTSQREVIKENLVQGLDRKGMPTANWDLGALVGAGGILSSAQDLVKYATYSFNAFQAEDASREKRNKASNADFNRVLGWHIIEGHRKAPFLWHNGGTGGYKASMAIDPSQKDAVIILTNVGTDTPGKSAIDELCFKLMETLE